MLGHGRLSEAEGNGDVADGTLFRTEILENLAAPGFGDRVERIGRGGSARHEPIIFPYRNMSTLVVPPVVLWAVP
jgi:hypothetical protein